MSRSPRKSPQSRPDTPTASESAVPPADASAPTSEDSSAADQASAADHASITSPSALSRSSVDAPWSLGPIPSLPAADAPAVPAVDPKNLAAGTVIDDYQIQRVLGKGAFATVYLALQLSLNRLVALKITRDLGNEGRRMARLEHPNIVQVYAEQIDPQQKLRLLTMQFVPGPTLQTALEELTESGPDTRWSGSDLLDCIDRHSGSVVEIRPDDFAVRERLRQMDHQQAACFLAAELAAGLHYAHTHGILHRDIKPANVLLNISGRPLLVDFNLAEESQPADGKRATIGGTLAWMAPEHLMAFEHSQNPDIQVGPPADLYSVCLILIRMITGRVPLFAEPAASDRSDRSDGSDQDSRTAAVRRLRKMRSGPPDFTLPAPTASQMSLQSVIRRATQPDPDQRTASAEQLSRELHGCRLLRQIEVHDAMQHPLLAFAARHPLKTFAAIGFAPHVVASVVNITYNAVRVSDLPVTPSAQAHTPLMNAFTQLTLAYNLLVWPFAVFLVRRLVSSSLDAIRMRPCESEDQESHQRRTAVGLPYQMLIIAAAGWLPGIVFFPAGLRLLAGVELLPASVHFTLNFLTCALLATTYSFLALAWYGASVCWPRHWLFPQRLPSVRIDREFRNYVRDLRWARLAAAVVPLVSCMLLVVTMDPGNAESGSRLPLFKMLVLMLISLGLLGPLLANQIAMRVTERVNVFSGNLHRSQNASAPAADTASDAARQPA